MIRPIKTIYNYLRKRVPKILSKCISKKSIAIFAVAVLLSSIVFPIIVSKKADALSTFTQDDWSGGVGVDPSNQYQSSTNITAGNTLEIGGQTIDNWCSTANCNSSWNYRKSITITNTGSQVDNQLVTINVTYDSNMKTDFSDVRFTDQAGTTEYGHWLSTKTDSVSAIFYVRIPTLVTNENTAYIYYGNASAGSKSQKSVLDFSDGFDQMGQVAATRSDPNIDFIWPDNTSPLSGVNATNWSVRWTGKINIPSTGSYSFMMFADDAYNVYIDDQPLFDGFWDLPAYSGYYKPVDLTVGDHDIKIEYKQSTGGAIAKLFWKTDSYEEIIPQSAFSYTDLESQDTVSGLYGEYFNDTKLGSGLGIQWADYSNWGYIYNISDSEIHLGGNNATSIQSNYSPDQSQTRTNEYDVKIPAPLGCVNSGNQVGYFSRIYLSYDNSTHDGCADYFSISYLENINNYNWDVLRSTHFQFDTWYRFKTVQYSSDDGYGADYFYSTDGGITYRKVPGYEKANWGVGSYFNFYLNNSDYKADVRNIIGYSSVNANQVSFQYGLEEMEGGGTGSLESVVIDFDAGAYFGKLNFSTSGDGNVGVKLRGSKLADMSDAPAFGTCNIIYNDQAIDNSICMHKGDRYVQYQILLSDDTPADVSVSNISIEYDNDPDAPATNASNILLKRSIGGSAVATDSWFRTTPVISWTAGADNSGGSGIGGYCLYVGGQQNGDPKTEAGILTGVSPVNTGGSCAYATNSTQLDLNTVQNSGLTTGQRYYINILALDNSGNVFAGQNAQTSFRFDSQNPRGESLFTPPGSTQNSKFFTTTWLYLPGIIVDSDEHSGIAGYKYCVTNMLLGFEGCGDDDPNWYGSQHTSGDLHDPNDVLPISDKAFTTVTADASRLDDGTTGGPGINAVMMQVVDNAGNSSEIYSISPYVYISVNAPSEPASLSVNPQNSNNNNFSFSWSAPSSYTGSATNLNYCWTVNVDIAEDQSNCHWTGAGITQLANGPYATRQGSNTFHIVAKDEAGNFDANNAASINFTATTAAPGAPTDLELSDVSTRATSTWKLASSWSAPSQSGSGVSSYKLYRSTDNINFTEVGTTSPSNLSFIDTGLSQVTYYYHVKACDNANNCSVASNVVSKKPTGRFTTAANLTSSGQPKATNIGPKKATITWTTDRDSDSKIAIGTKSGQYAAQEIGNSNQQPDHQVDLTNLQPGTTYYYVAKWTDEDGNTGTSAEKTFSTLPAPSVSEVSVGGVTISDATIKFTASRGSKAFISYGRTEAMGAKQTINISPESSVYTVNLDTLDDDAKYYYRIDLEDSDGNLYVKDILSFRTLARPKISNLQFQPVADAPSSTQKISWNTNVPTSSRISYGVAGTKFNDVIDSKLSTDHNTIITELADNSDYSLVVIATDTNGVSATSNNVSFKTALDTRSPKISNINVETQILGTGGEARGQMVVSWKTDEPSTSRVAYGPGSTGAYTNYSGDDTKLSTDHIVVVSNIKTASIYHLQVISADKSKNEARSESQTEIVGRASDNIVTIVYKSLQAIFGR